MTKFKIIETKQKQKINEGFWDAVESPLATAGAAIKGSKLGQKPGVQQAGRIAWKGLGLLRRFADAMGVNTRAVDMVGNIVGKGDRKGAPTIQKFKDGLTTWASTLAAGIPNDPVQNKQFLTDIGWFKLSAQGNKFNDADLLMGYELGGTQKTIADFKERMKSLALFNLFTRSAFWSGIKLKKNELAKDPPGSGIPSSGNQAFLVSIGYTNTMSSFNDTDLLSNYRAFGNKLTILDFKQHWHSLAKGGMLG